MNKRLLKRHQRQVARAKERVKLSEPDVRTPEQVAAAREASRAIAGRRNEPHELYATPAVQNQAGPGAASTGKVDADS